MSPESSFYGFKGDQMLDTQELLQERERFFKFADINTLPVFCGDERTPVKQGMYIHVFGGVGFQAYNLGVMQEVVKPSSVNQPFEDLVVAQISPLQTSNVLAGVHSDESAEHGDKLNAHQLLGDFGCGYLAKRGPIGLLIVEKADLIIAETKILRPELFRGKVDDRHAAAVIEAQQRLATRPGFLTDGRTIGLKAIHHGAPSMVVSGSHSAQEGIINLVSDTSFDNTEANVNGRPTYDHDQWAAMAMFDKVRNLYPYDKRHYDIACTIDAIGTMKALGVETIAARR